MNAARLMLALLLVSQPLGAAPPDTAPEFYSREGREVRVSFTGEYLSHFRSLAEIQALSASQRSDLQDYELPETLKFLYGPLTRRELGNPQRGARVSVDWDRAELVRGRVRLPYAYEGVWIVQKDLASRGSLQIPVPYSSADLQTRQWRRCTDVDPEHQTLSFYWYFWDPERTGCDHVSGEHFELRTVTFGTATRNEPQTYPEYSRLLRETLRGGRRLSITLAFGYVEDPAQPRPDTDADPGAAQYRLFLKQFRARWGSALKESKILQGEYPRSSSPTLAIGRRFEGLNGNVNVSVQVVAAAGVESMEIFAKSFAHDHDSVFGWFGHSRVGSSFDASAFAALVRLHPEYYQVTPDYQVVYWGGCNSYSYYTLPFFEFKAQASAGLDPRGTRGLDIIANGLPSYFSLNASNAMAAADAFLTWRSPTSYQVLIDRIEAEAGERGALPMVAVLGDEDNAAP